MLLFCIPVVTILPGPGQMPADHPLIPGMAGMHGIIAANHAVSGCDLLPAMGTRFSGRVIGTSGIFAPGAAVIPRDIYPAEIRKSGMWIFP